MARWWSDKQSDSFRGRYPLVLDESILCELAGGRTKIPRNKIAAGVALYGYDFAYGKEPDDLSGEVPPGYKVMRYKDILAQFPDASTAVHGNIKVAGSTPRPPFIAAPGTYPFAHNIYFETPDTAVTKLNFLKDVGAQGVIIWELSNDVWEEGKSVIKALYKNSGNLVTRPPLIGSTAGAKAPGTALYRESGLTASRSERHAPSRTPERPRPV